MNATDKLATAAKAKGTSLTKLSRMLGRNPTYLQQFITKGSPRRLEEQDRRNLADFLDISEEDLGGRSVDKRGSRGGWLEVGRLNVEAAAGHGALPQGEESYDSFRFSKKWLAEQGLEGAELSSIRVVGDSMEPILREGDEVLVDLRNQPFRDGIYVVRFEDSLLVKRVASKGKGQFSLLSQNLAYPPISVGYDEIHLVGRVVWKGGRL